MPRPSPLVWLLAALLPAPAAPAQDPAPAAGQRPAANVYQLSPFHADFPVALEYPDRSGRDYDRTTRQALEQVVANLQGGARREAWQMATEFFWRAPDAAVEPLVEAMDRAFGNPALADVVNNCVEAMGKMANERCDAALQRALTHKNTNVRQSALTALCRSGKVDTVRGLFRHFDQIPGHARAGWLAAARKRLGDEAVPMFRQLMLADLPGPVRDQALVETLKLPVAQAAEVLRGRWADAAGEFKPIIAGVLHAAGDGAGTAWLHEVLQGDDLSLLVPAVRHCAYGDPGELREDLLRLSSHPRPEVRLELARLLARYDGDDVCRVFELLAGPDETMEVRAIALRELTRRGQPQVVTAMIEELPAATGTRLQLLLHELAQSGDARAVPVFVERLGKAPEGQGRQFVQALARLRGDAAAQAMIALFLGPERTLDRSSSGERHTTTSYLPTLLLNLRGSEARIVATFRKLPREDWRRRASLLPTIAGIAGDREDRQIQELCTPVVRDVLFDRAELPQLRVLALNLLTRRFLTI
ncbi:MAG: hypothetical protein FJ265_20110, partial [Planctomycetes bacterium]|nr:hypothetical protein [Planctomycetota bacterium]